MSAESLKTVERTLALLKAFGRATPELSVSDLVDRLVVPRSVVVRMLATLEQAEFVERVPGNPRLFRIGIGAGEVGSLYFHTSPLLRGAEDVLGGLAERTGFTAYLGTIHGAEAVILALREGRTPVRFIWQAGERLPVATTSFGKAMLMHMGREQVDRMLGSGPLARLTEGSVRTRAELDAQLARCAHKGWVPAFEESFPGVYAVGAALLDAQGAPVAGISLSFLRNSADPAQVETMGSSVLEAARTISRRLALSDAYGHHGLGKLPLRHETALPTCAPPHDEEVLA
ncbi:MAG: IclR family transcriptional regulator [Acetobacteraceae bacterium]|nr:IclR family transcriptional regulator [Acetobacteraceae bacterium]